MSTVMLSQPTYDLLSRRASQKSESPDQLADNLLRQQLMPEHAYVEIVQRTSGKRAVIKGSNVPVSIIIGYLRIGETPESIVETIMPHLKLAEVYDALSYYHERPDEIEQEISKNSEAYGRAYLRERLGDDEYYRVTGQTE